MTLGELLARAGVLGSLTAGAAKLHVAGLDYDSRRIARDFVFFAFPGERVDGRSFAVEAVAKGACAVVSESPAPAGFPAPPAPAGFPTPWIEVEHGRRALATASANFYNHPDRRVHFTGITGTNGKTTTAYLIDAILREAGFVTGMIGTIEYRLAGEVRPAPNTTPESLDVMRFAAELESRAQGQQRTHLISEVSSHALALGRVFGFRFHTAVFTNLTRDHLNFHGTMESYAASKRLLFVPEEVPPPAWAILNSEDAASASMNPGAAAHVIWYGTTRGADLRAENIRPGFQGLQFDLVWNGQRQTVISPLVGRFNVLNILAAAGAGLSYGLKLDAIAEGIEALKAVPGRFERVDAGQPFLVVVDYAHTDDALRNVIRAAREITQGRVITLFGCGGDRDRTKRPLMGMAAAELSDYVVLTSDNPRSEDPIAIMNDALVGLRRFDTPHSIEPDRGRAIHIAIQQAQPGDVVLLTGKGHETYQIFKDRTIHFDDREVAREALKSLA